MKAIDQVQTILEQEMDRKQFLKVAGAAALGVIGVTKILNSLSGMGQKKQQPLGQGYGSSAYGK